jgi:hypothetical protein
MSELVVMEDDIVTVLETVASIALCRALLKFTSADPTGLLESGSCAGNISWSFGFAEMVWNKTATIRAAKSTLSKVLRLPSLDGSNLSFIILHSSKGKW